MVLRCFKMSQINFIHNKILITLVTSLKNMVKRAKSLGIRSAQAFGDMVRQDMIASGKVMTPQQEMLSYMFGNPGRDESGRIQNTYKRYVPLSERNQAVG
jgi:hypothetical protein